ncbi:hypothetical protein IW261DRAFT_1414910 [Armillaria novae-zelandiae]|uniref:Uncharacterized protein n=1 Tax=Armillaria novae-zelandiae TaxID=153914 RepID=A0AA39PMQ0_9AGAR|nr:hypothetical protein IW261DRAFT_1414910 [Armillaria novae-zelandiae]
MDIDNRGEVPMPVPPPQNDPHAFVPYKSPIHLHDKTQLDNHCKSDYVDNTDEEDGGKHIKGTLTQMPHLNRQGPQPLTSGWEYYSKYRPVLSSALQTLERDQYKKDLPPPTGHRGQIEPHLSNMVGEAEKILSIVQADPNTQPATHWRYILSDLQERIQLCTNGWMRGSILSEGSHWLVSNWPSGIPMETQTLIRPTKIGTPPSGAPIAGCPGVYIIRDGPIICSTVDAWRLSLDVGPYHSQVGQHHLRTCFNDVFIMLALRPGWYGKFLTHHKIAIAKRLDCSVRFPTAWLANLDFTSMSHFLAEHGLPGAILVAYNDMVPPLIEGWDLAWISRYHRECVAWMDRDSNEWKHSKDTAAVEVAEDPPPTGVVPRDFDTVGLSIVGGVLPAVSGLDPTDSLPESGLQSGSKPIPTTDDSPTVTAPPESGADVDTEAPTVCTSPSAPPSPLITKVNDPNALVPTPDMTTAPDIVMANPLVDLATAVPLPESDDENL